VILLIPAFTLLATALLIMLLGILRPRFSYHWLLAVIGALAAWISLWVIYTKMPLVFGSLEGNYASLALPSLSLRADHDSWPAALAVATLCLAALFTDVGNVTDTNWMVWAGDLWLTALGVLAVMASNPATLILVWTLLDVIELGILLRQVREEGIRHRVMVFFTTNVLGILMIFGAMIAASGAGVRMNFERIPQQSQLYLILAVGLRMGVFPLQVAFLRDSRSQRGQATLLRLIPAAAGFSLLVHTARVESPVGLRGMLLFFALLAALYGAIVWVRVADELRGRIFWMVGMGGMVFFSAVQSQPAATLSWGLAMLYTGALLFLASVRQRYLIPLGILGAFSLTGLPFSPTYAGMRVYQPTHIFLLLLPIAHALLLVGFLRHMLRETEPIQGVERWVKVIYPAGLGLLPLSHYLSIYLNPNIPISGPMAYIPLGGMLLVLIVLALGYWRKVRLPEGVFLSLDRVFSLRWIYDVIGWADKAVGRVIFLVSLLIEGEGGVLWTLVFLMMLVSILAQIYSGAGL
jgi:hypothetical protein